MRAPSLTRVVAAAALLAGAACETPRAPPAFAGPAPASFSAEVWHNAPVAASLGVYIRGPDGLSRRLGRVEPSRTETLELPGPLTGGEYRLIAETIDGRWIVSPPFSLAGDGVRWDVDRNRIGALWKPEP